MTAQHHECRECQPQLSPITEARLNRYLAHIAHLLNVDNLEMIKVLVNDSIDDAKHLAAVLPDGDPVAHKFLDTAQNLMRVELGLVFLTRFCEDQKAAK